ADLKLLMSEQESFGLVLLESMACEVATIGTAVGGIPEVVNDGDTGYIVAVGYTARASELALRLLTDEGLPARFSKQARRRMEEIFSSDTIISQYIQLYERLLR